MDANAHDLSKIQIILRVKQSWRGGSLANLDHFSPQIRDFSHLHQPELESLSPNYSLQNSTSISPKFNSYPPKIQHLFLWQRKTTQMGSVGSYTLVSPNRNCSPQIVIPAFPLEVERNRNQVFVPEQDILFPYFKFRFRLSRYRISGRKKAGKFVIL